MFIFQRVNGLNLYISVSLSSWKGRTVRAALSTVYAVTAAHTPTRPAARCPSCPLTPWGALRRCRRLPPSRCPSCPPLTPLQPMGRSRRNRTPSRSGRSPGACTRAGVSSPASFPLVLPLALFFFKQATTVKLSHKKFYYVEITRCIRAVTIHYISWYDTSESIVTPLSINSFINTQYYTKLIFLNILNFTQHCNAFIFREN